MSVAWLIDYLQSCDPHAIVEVGQVGGWSTDIVDIVTRTHPTNGDRDTIQVVTIYPMYGPDADIAEDDPYVWPEEEAGR